MQQQTNKESKQKLSSEANEVDSIESEAETIEEKQKSFN